LSGQKKNFNPPASYFQTISTLNCFNDFTVNIAFRDFYRNIDEGFNGVNYFAEVLLILSVSSLGLWIIALITRVILVCLRNREGLDPVATDEDEKPKYKPTQGIELLFTDKA